jgi:protoheme IX farnesyltransferase
MAVGGLAWLMLTVNLVTVLLAALTLGIYILIYTPLKRRTSFCVAVGAVSGAIPPVIGWSAVNPKASEGALILFGVLFLWQMPHFLSIAWMYRDQYAQAGFRMVRKSDASGANTAASAFLFSLGLVGVATAPAFLGMTSYVYLAGAMLLNAVLLLCAVQFCMERTRPVARRLFFSSILYLPLLLGLMVFTKN